MEPQDSAKACLGFILATHGNPVQVLMLCERLTARFEVPPIVVHHDFGKCPLETGSFPANVTFVPDWSATAWGRWGVVEGVLKALRILYTQHDPEWFVLLSGSDYPIKTAEQIWSDLRSHDFDAYLDYRRIERCDLPLPRNGWGDQNFIAPAWVRLAFERYMAIGFGFYKLATRLGWSRKAIYLKSNFFIRRFTPFDGVTACYAGDFWLTANRRAAASLLSEESGNQRLIAHFKMRPNPDEGFFHTVLGNDRDLKISSDNKRFSDWVGMVNHPRELDEADFPTLVASSDHFARKFALDAEALQRLDAQVDAAAAASSRANARLA